MLNDTFEFSSIQKIVTELSCQALALYHILAHSNYTGSLAPCVLVFWEDSHTNKKRRLWKVLRVLVHS